MAKSDSREKILKLLADELGIESEDIANSDQFKEDLHMSAVDISDFAHLLETHGYEITPEEVSDYESVGELLENLVEE